VRALVITRAGGPEVLKVEERPDPVTGAGEVRVAVKAAGINFADVMARAGLYPDAPKPPCVVGYEFAGVVEGVGDGVADFAPGDRVIGGSRFGAYAELVATPANALVPLPDDWSFEEGAAFPVNYSTAYAGLCRYGGLAAGERMLVQAAAGGVGIAATQIAKILGAEVFGTASPSKHEACRGFGVDHPIDYRGQDFVAEVRRITGEKEPLDLVMDAVGGRSFRRSWSLLGPGGRLVCFGASSLVSGERRNLLTALRTYFGMPRFNPIPMMTNSKSVIGLNMLTLWDHKGSLDEYIQPLTRWVDEGRLRPVVAEAFPLERGGDAHRMIIERRNVGKVVLTLT
jgi:NADPH:quinone reductase-like Zn-dependent oxidoreductase